jgi:rRNA maturation RNase YbeY
MIRVLLEEFLSVPRFDVSIQIVGRTEIIRLNETFLRHAGATDVIAFDYRDASVASGVLHGEVFVCLPVAFEQSRRFRTSWQRELVRYAVHGVLHLWGYDDRNEQARRLMKRAEDKALELLFRRFYVGKLGGPSGLPHKSRPSHGRSGQITGSSGMAWGGAAFN